MNTTLLAIIRRNLPRYPVGRINRHDAMRAVLRVLRGGV
jgi:hypothetical protein